MVLRHLFRGLYVYVLLVVLAQRAEARADSTTFEPEWMVETWRIDAGLPHNSVTALLQTRDGYLWIATSNGLARFDGLRFVNFRTTDDAGLKSSHIWCLLQDGSETLWVGTEQGLACYRSGRFFNAPMPEDATGERILCLAGDGASNVWVGASSGLYRCAGEQRTTLFQGEGLPNSSITAICQPRNTPVIFATTAGLFRFAGNRIVAWQSAFWPEVGGNISRMLEDASGQLWLATDRGVWRFANSAMRANAPPLKFYDGKALSLLERSKGEVWIGTAGGDLLVVATNLSSGTLRRVWHFPSSVTGLCEDAEGNVWVGTAADGLHRLRSRQLRCLPVADSSDGTGIPCLYETFDGELEYVTPEGDCQRLRDGRFSKRETVGLPPGLSLRTACVTSDGDLWLGTVGDGVFRCRSNIVAQITEYDGLSGNAVEVLSADASGGLWVGTRNGGLNFIRNGEIRRMNTPWGFTGSYACSLAPGPDGDLWIGTTGDGLFRRRDGQFTAPGFFTNLPSGTVRSLCVSADGVIWVGTSRGLCRLKNSQITPYSGKSGLPADAVWQLRRDTQGNLWIGYSGAILRVPEQQLNDCADGKLAALDAVAYGREDGLPNLQCLPAADSASSHGRVWFATTRGLVLPVQPALRWNTVPPPVLLEQVLLENEPVPVAGSIEVPPGRESLQFRYTALSFTAPTKVVFRYRLEGFDHEWSEVTANRLARYPRLPAGQYTFQVLARNDDGLWNERGATIAVRVRAFWWETFWFRAVIIAAVAAIGGGFYRLRQIRRRELERLRVRIASDLHDDLGSSLWSITLLSRLVAQSPKLGAEERQDVNEINRIAVQTSNSIRDIIWLINPAFDSLQDLLLRTKDFAAVALRGADYSLRSEGIDLSRKLPVDVRQNLFLLFKEALTNIAKHARATAVEMEVREHQDGWQFRIRDNGVGFDLTAPHAGNGLKNLRTRADSIRARIEIQTRPGQGTQLIITTRFS